MKSSTLRATAGPALILILLTGVAFVARPLTPIDETRYISVAWEMWLNQEYLVLLKNGQPYSDKPPLLFWLYNLGWLVFGVNEWWPRLVSPLFSLGGLMLTFSIARRLWPDEHNVVRNALWILGSSLLWLVFSTSAMFDAMLAFCVLLGMRGLLIAADQSRARGFAWLAVAIGCGILAKGPVVLLHLLPTAVLAPWWRPGMEWKRWYGGLLLAVLGGATIALAWAIPAAIHGGEEYRNAIFWGQTAHRMVSSFAHQRPFWWYLPLLPLLLFPWLLWPTLWRRVAALRREGLDGGLRFCLAWLVPVFVSFSLISGKQVHYLVPLIPPAALLAGRALRRASGSPWLPALAVALFGAAVAYAVLAGIPAVRRLPAVPLVWPGTVLVLGALFALWAARRESWCIPSLAVLGALAFAGLQLSASPILWRAYDVRPMANAIRQLQSERRPVANLGTYHAQYHFAARLERPLEELGPQELPQWLATHPEGAVIAYGKGTRLPRAFLFSQPYLERTAVLLSAPDAQAALAELGGDDS
jgi:4-amino-4-deoxy-L-arabinose transferase-like glycosyltransferase